MKLLGLVLMLFIYSKKKQLLSDTMCLGRSEQLVVLFMGVDVAGSEAVLVSRAAMMPCWALAFRARLPT